PIGAFADLTHSGGILGGRLRSLERKNNVRTRGLRVNATRSATCTQQYWRRLFARAELEHPDLFCCARGNSVTARPDKHDALSTGSDGPAVGIVLGHQSSIQGCDSAVRIEKCLLEQERASSYALANRPEGAGEVLRGGGGIVTGVSPCDGKTVQVPHARADADHVDAEAHVLGRDDGGNRCRDVVVCRA